MPGVTSAGLFEAGCELERGHTGRGEQARLSGPCSTFGPCPWTALPLTAPAWLRCTGPARAPRWSRRPGGGRAAEGRGRDCWHRHGTRSSPGHLAQPLSTSEGVAERGEAVREGVDLEAAVFTEELGQAGWRCLAHVALVGHAWHSGRLVDGDVAVATKEQAPPPVRSCTTANQG